MKLKILGKSKNTLKLEIEGENHSLLNLIKNELLEDKYRKIEAVAYFRNHPYLGSPVLVLKTKKESPINAVKRAARRVSDKCKEFRIEFERAMKK